ncbi:MAG: PAS domain S-box protein, partial [Opitutaceae bacterium]|nr:PAS domain S-box protein [Cytophagales bacterium]
DRSGKKRAEEKLLKVNRLYSFLSAVNQSIVHINDEQELLTNACSIATNIGDFKMAWIGMLDENGKLNIVQLQGDRSALQGIKNYSGMDFTIPLLVDTPTGRALRTGKYALSNQVQNDPVMEPWKDELALHGIKANISLPLIKFGKVIGVFGLNSATDNFFDEQEIKLLTEAAGDISFALELFENARRHKETEELVERNEKLFRTLIEKSGSIKALGTREGKIFYVSPSVTKYLGYTLNEFLDLSFPYLVHDDDLQEFLGKRLRILETDGSSFCQELRVKHQNGNWIWCECIITNLLNEPGINALVVNVRDISEKKTIELELEFEQNNLNALINNTTDLMWSIDKEYKIISCNEPFENYIRNASGHKISDVGMPLEQQKRHMLFLNRALTGESFKALECIDGPVERWSEISFYPIKKDNEVIGTACHSHDITNSKKAEIQLRKSEIFNRGVLNSLSSHIAVMDGSGNIVAVNEAWKRFALENETSALHNTSEGSNYFSVCEVADKAGDEIAYEVMQGMKDVLYERTKVYNLEYPSHDPEKNQWFAMRALKFESGEPMVVVSYQDITERKLGEEKLIQQNEELRKTNEELDRFVYSASHDLRAPLTSILGLVYLIEVKCLEKDTLQFTGMIKSSIHRLDGFIKNILDYARNNRTELLTEHIPLEENINGIVDSLRNMAAVNGIDFEVSITELVPFYSDQQRVNIVIGNLLSNAIKFQDLSKPHRFIKITGESIKNSLHLRVEDNGIGIPAEFLPRIFDMFFRLSGSEAGSGIGLYIVKEKVEKLKGTIEVESHEGIGTTFILKLKNLMMEEANAEDDSRTESGSAPD